MNKLFIKLLMAGSIFFFLFGCTNTSKELAAVVDIKDARNTQEPEPNLTSHKPYDVEVYRIIFMEESYKVIYYRKENDSLKSHVAYYGSKDDYNKAAYHWLSDTTVSIRLFSTTSNKELTFNLFGKGSASGIDTDK